MVGTDVQCLCVPVRGGETMAGWCIELAWPPPAADGLAWRGPRFRLGVFHKIASPTASRTLPCAPDLQPARFLPVRCRQHADHLRHHSVRNGCASWPGACARARCAAPVCISVVFPLQLFCPRQLLCSTLVGAGISKADGGAWPACETPHAWLPFVLCLLRTTASHASCCPRVNAPAVLVPCLQCVSSFTTPCPSPLRTTVSGRADPVCCLRWSGKKTKAVCKCFSGCVWLWSCPAAAGLPYLAASCSPADQESGRAGRDGKPAVCRCYFRLGGGWALGDGCLGRRPASPGALLAGAGCKQGEHALGVEQSACSPWEDPKAGLAGWLAALCPVAAS